MPPQHTLVLYAVIPLWLLAGSADWLCHRRTHIEDTSGAHESVLHLLMLAEIGLPLLMIVYFDVNAMALGILGVAIVAHEITAFMDVSYAISRRHVSAFEQCIHSVLEICPLAVLLLIATAHWGQWLALWGIGDESPRIGFIRSPQGPPPTYSAFLAASTLSLGLLPYVEEWVRTRRADRRRGLRNAPSGPGSRPEQT
jgi:hypothetical protein